MGRKKGSLLGGAKKLGRKEARVVVFHNRDGFMFWLLELHN